MEAFSAWLTAEDLKQEPTVLITLITSSSLESNQGEEKFKI